MTPEEKAAADAKAGGLSWLERKATEHKKGWRDLARELGVVPGPTPPAMEAASKRPVIAPDASGVAFTPKLVQKPTIAAEAGADLNQAAAADAKARAEAENAVTGPQLVGMTRAQMLPDTTSLKVAGANPAGPEELAALNAYMQHRKNAAGLALEGDPRQKALSELQQAIAQHQLRGVDQENAIRADDERVMGQLREKAQKAWDNAEKDLEPDFGKTMVMALIAAFGGQYGAQIVSSLIDADVREKELAYSGKRDKARGAEADLKGFSELSKDAGTRRQEMRLQRLMAAVKIGEAQIARMPNNEARIQAETVQAELAKEMAGTLEGLYARQRGNVTLEKSKKFAPAKGIYAGGGKKKDAKLPPSEVEALKGEIKDSGREWRREEMHKKQASLEEVLAIANEGVGETQQFSLNQMLSNPGITSRVFARVAGLPPAKQARAMQSILAMQREINGARATEQDALRNALSMDLSAGAPVFQGAVEIFNKQAAAFVGPEGRGGRGVLGETEKVKKNYAPLIGPSGEKAKALKALK